MSITCCTWAICTWNDTIYNKLYFNWN